MVTSATLGVPSQRLSSSRSNLETVDLPTATEPATPIMNGTGLARSPKNSLVALWMSACFVTYKFRKRLRGKYTSETSVRSRKSPRPLI